MSCTASMVPEHRSCCSTRDGVKPPGAISALGLMHRTKCALVRVCSVVRVCGIVGGRGVMRVCSVVRGCSKVRLGAAQIGHEIVEVVNETA